MQNVLLRMWYFGNVALQRIELHVPQIKDAGPWEQCLAKSCAEPRCGDAKVSQRQLAERSAE
jgi:hypothetical protein